MASGASMPQRRYVTPPCCGNWRKVVATVSVRAVVWRCGACLAAPSREGPWLYDRPPKSWRGNPQSRLRIHRGTPRLAHAGGEQDWGDRRGIGRRSGWLLVGASKGVCPTNAGRALVKMEFSCCALSLDLLGTSLAPFKNLACPTMTGEGTTCWRAPGAITILCRAWRSSGGNGSVLRRGCHPGHSRSGQARAEYEAKVADRRPSLPTRGPHLD